MCLSKNHLFINEKDSIKIGGLPWFMCLSKNHLYIDEKDNIKIRGFSQFHVPV